MAENSTYTPYTLADIERYLQGKMSAREMHDMEKAALQDPFLSDSIEGFGQASSTLSRQHLNEITASLTAQNTPARVIAMPVRRTRLWVQVSVAASLLLVASAVWLLLTKTSTGPSNKTVAANVPSHPAGASMIDSAVAGDNKQSMAKTTELTTPKNNLAKKSATTSAKDGDGVKDIIDSTGTAGSLAAAKPAEKEMKEPAKLDSAIVAPDTDDKNTLVAAPPATVVNKVAAAESKQSSRGKFANGYIANDSTAAYRSTNANNYSTSNNNAFARQKGPAQSNLNLHIQLTPTPGFDSTVTVTYLNNRSDIHKMVADTSLFPQGGWQSFRDYVSKQLHKEIDTTNDAYAEGDVELEFTIDESGIARDIHIIKSLNRQSDAEAMDFVKKWPSWVTTKKNKKGKVVIQF